MRLFGRGRWRRREVKLTAQLCRYLDSWQRRLADRLNAWYGSVPAGKLCLWLVLGCTVVSGYLCWVLFSAFG